VGNSKPYIGSSTQCQIYLFKDPNIKPRPAAIHLAPGGLELEDLASGTGTFVNGKVVSRVRLHNGDQIQIASTAFVFQENYAGTLIPKAKSCAGSLHRSRDRR